VARSSEAFRATTRVSSSTRACGRARDSVEGAAREHEMTSASRSRSNDLLVFAPVF
jgi:hypothetical protein